MRRKSKYKYLIVILLIIFISIGFAYLTSNLDIVGLGHLKRTVWKIYFDNVNILEGGNLTSTPPTTSNHNTTSVTYSVTMDKPGDVYKFNIDIVNNGTVDAMVSIIDENTILTSNQSKYASYSIKYLDGSPIEENNFLGRHSKETIQVIIKYKKDITSSDLPTTQMNLSFNLSLNYKQAKNSDNRQGESTIITDLSGNGNDGVMYGGRINADGTLYLDGVDDKLNMGLKQYDFHDSISLVIKFKFNTSPAGAERGIFCNIQNAGSCIKIVGVGVPRFIFHNGTNYVGVNMKMSPILNVNEWYTVVATYDGSNIKMYLNGTKMLLANDSYEYPVTGNLAISNGEFKLGAALSPTNMSVSDALIFDRALTEEEIANDYTLNINPTNTDDLLLRYKFSSNNTVKDLSGNNHKGTIIGATINNDGTITTDGINDYIDCGLSNYNFGSNVSLVARVKFLSLDGIDPAILANFQNAGIGLYLKSQYISFTSHKSTWIRYMSNVKPELNKWYTLVGTYDGSKMKLYINGKETSVTGTTDTYQVARTGDIDISKQFMIGADPNSDGTFGEDFSNIIVSDALIFDRTLTKQEVENDYAKTISPSNREDLLLYYHFG